MAGRLATNESRRHRRVNRPDPGLEFAKLSDFKKPRSGGLKPDRGRRMDLSASQNRRKMTRAMTDRVHFLLAVVLACPGCAATPPADPLKSRLIGQENRFLERLTGPSALFVEDPDLLLPVDDILPSSTR